jgi:hypothetical protein
VLARQRRKLGLPGKMLARNTGSSGSRACVSLSCAEGRSRMWLARVCSTVVAGMPLIRFSTSLSTWMPAPERTTRQIARCHVTAGFDKQRRVTIGRTQSELAAGAAIGASDSSRASAEKSSPARARSTTRCALRLGAATWAALASSGSASNTCEMIQFGWQGTLQLLLVPQVLVDLEFGHPHFLVDVALAHPHQHQLVAQLLAELVARSIPSRASRLYISGHVDLVLARDVELGLIDRGVVDADAGIARLLQLRALVDQALQRTGGQLAYWLSPACCDWASWRPRRWASWRTWWLVIGSEFTTATM